MKILDVRDATNVNEVLEAIGAGENYSEQLVATRNGEGQPVMMEKYKAILDGKGQPICINNESYSLLQPIEAFAYADDVRAEFNAEYHQAGFIDNGKKMFIKMNMPNAHVVQTPQKVGDPLDFEINLWTSFDGSMPTDFSYGWVRLVCNNGMTAFQAEKRARVRHTKNQRTRLEMAVASITGVKRTITHNSALFNRLANVQITDSKVDDLLKRWYSGHSTRTQNTRTQLFNLYRTGQGNNGQTAWDLYNAITEYQTHHATYRGQENVRMQDENRFVSLNVGRAREFQTNVLADLEVLANN